ncbi:MAG: hypothetical protein K1T65_01675, partial [Candidatus Aramenus sp.]|nr:hypothetical protein [Candidatus Aramenus sp.]
MKELGTERGATYPEEGGVFFIIPRNGRGKALDMPFRILLRLSAVYLPSNSYINPPRPTFKKYIGCSK